jgi:branched-chain amino acid transport system substrate-binding protein
MRRLTAALLLLLASGFARADYRVGVALPLTGPEQQAGHLMLRALELGAEDINRAGGVAGRKLELVVADDGDDSVKAHAVAERFAADAGISAVIGHYNDLPALSVMPVYDRAKLPVIFPALSNPDLVNVSSYVFTANVSDERSAETLAAYLHAVAGARSAVVFYRDDLYGRYLDREFARKAGRLGLSLKRFPYPADAASTLPPDFAAKRWSGAPDAVVIFGHSSKAGAIIGQLRDRGIKTPIYGSDRIAPGLIARLGKNATDVRIAFPFLFDFASLEGVKFGERFKKRYGAEPSVYAAFAYDALGLTAKALAKSGPDRRAVRGALASFNSDDAAYPGVTGELYFDKDGYTVRDVVMGIAHGDQFRPCFTQLRVVTDPHQLELLPRKAETGEIVVVDKTPFYKVHLVYVGVDYRRVAQVAIKDLAFETEFFLWFKWAGDVDVDGIGFVNEVPGKVSRVKLLDNLAEAKGPDAEKWASYRVKGTFVHPYNLRLFPFDTQSLPLKIAHKTLDANHLALVADRGFITDRPVTEIYPQEWRYTGREDFSGTFNYESNFGNPEYARSEAQADFSVYQSDLVIRRILFPYLITLFLPLALLISVSLLVLLIPKEQFSARSGLVMSALLGVLVYHMAQARGLPQVGYLVRADLYFVAAYFLLFFLVLGLNVVNFLLAQKKEELADKLDRRLRRSFASATIVVYGLLTASAFWTR